MTGRGSPASVSSILNHSKATSEAGEKASANKTGLGRFISSNSSSKSSVVDKVKADFNTSRRERVVHLTRLPALHSDTPSRSRHSDPTIFADLQTRLKECVSATFDAVVELQGDVVKREGAKKDVPGWNFCKWMTGMECIASTFEGVGLYSDALSQYEEVEAAFLQCLQERNLPFFSHVGGTAAGDDSAPLLDTSKKNYRELILRNEISLFDFRTYVFAKRAGLLGKLGRVSQVMNETPIFLSGVGAMLQGESLPRHFLESWTFSCSIDVVEQCQAWLIERGDVSAPGMGDDNEDDVKSPSSRAIEGQLSAAFHSAKAELLDLARRQLDKIGIDVGHLPNAVPFSLSLPHGSFGRDRQLPPLPDQEGDVFHVDGSITRQELLSAIDDIEVFDLHYVSLTERVVAGWISGGRSRNVLRLRCVLGSLDFFRQRYEQSYAKFVSLPGPYHEGRWSSIEASHLAKQLECHHQLNKVRDRAWVSVMIALLETCPRQKPVVTSEHNSIADLSSRWLDPSFLCSELREGAKSFTQEIPISTFEPIQIHVSNQVAQITSENNEDGTRISVNVDNQLACPLSVDDVRICLINGPGKEMWFTSGLIELKEGTTKLNLFCPSMTIPGKYVVDVSQIRLSKVIVQYQHRKTGKSFKESTFVDVLEDGNALSVAMELERNVWLDQSRKCIMDIWTGRNDVDKMSVRLMYKDTRELVKGLLEAQIVKDEVEPKNTTLDVDKDNAEVTLKDVPPLSVVGLSIPLHEYSGAVDGLISFIVEIDYWIRRQDGSILARKKQLKHELRLSVGLPLGVNVQDFFRRDQLFSKFIISAGSGGILRLGDVKLECEAVAQEGKEVAPYEISGSMQDGEVIVTPSQTASYVFGIQRTNKGRITNVNRNLRLTLSYQTLQEEAIQTVLSHLNSVISTVTSEKQVSLTLKRCLEKSLTSFVTSHLDLNTYLSHRRFQFSDRSGKQWRSICRRWVGIDSQSQEQMVLKVIRDTLDATKERGMDTKRDLSKWRQLSLIVDVPKMNIVNAVTMELKNTSQEVRVGEIIQVDAIIDSSFFWSDEDDEAEKVIYLSVDVQCDFLNWLVVGSKRSVIEVATSSNDTSSSTIQNRMELSLVAIKSGDLCLPGVTLWPVANPILTTPPSHAHRDKESNAIQFEEEKRRLDQVQSLSCDTFITNEAETITVVSPLQGADRRTYWMNV